MAKYSTYETVGAKEDVSDIITNLTPTKTPFQSMIGNEKIKQRVHEWQEDALDAVADNAKVEGFVASSDTAIPTVMRQNNTQILSRTAEVTGSTEEQESYGRKSELAYQLRKKSQELKRDLENAFVGTGQTAVTGTSSVARKMAGVQAQIAATATITVDIDSGTGGNQAGPLTEAIFNTANEKCYTLGTEASVLMVKPADAKIISAFATASGRYREIGESGRKLVNVIDVLVTPYGEQRVVMNRFLRATDALLLDADNWKKLTYRPWFRETLAKTGDSTSVMLVGEFSLKHLHREASVLITNLT